jgi:hypothetical protein
MDATQEKMNAHLRELIEEVKGFRKGMKGLPRNDGGKSGVQGANLCGNEVCGGA